MTHPDLIETESQWRGRLAALIRAGWGETPQEEIPPDWRTRYGPDRSLSSEVRANVSAGKRRQWAERKRAERDERRRKRIEEAAARMRAKYLTPMRVSRQANGAQSWKSRRYA